MKQHHRSGACRPLVHRIPLTLSACPSEGAVQGIPLSTRCHWLLHTGRSPSTRRAWEDSGSSAAGTVITERPTTSVVDSPPPPRRRRSALRLCIRVSTSFRKSVSPSVHENSSNHRRLQRLASPGSQSLVTNGDCSESLRFKTREHVNGDIRTQLLCVKTHHASFHH